MIIGHNTLEWNDGTPKEAGYYLCLTKNNDIIRGFRRISLIPGGGGKRHHPDEWSIGSGDDIHACGEGYIIAWAEWPRGYDLRDSLECPSCGKDPGEATEDEDDDCFWTLTCQHCGEVGGCGYSQASAEEECSIRKRLDKAKGE